MQMKSIVENVKVSKQLSEKLESRVIETLDQWGEKIEDLDSIIHGDMTQITD